MRGRAALTGLIAMVMVGMLTSCEKVDQFRDRRRPATPHEAYLRGLQDAGLASTALAREWIDQSVGAVRDALPVELPFQEEGFIPPEDPTAVGYRFHLRRGQMLTIALEVESDDSTRVFLDLFRMPEDPADPPRPVPGVDTTATGMLYEPPRAGDFVVRVQPELLRGGHYRLSLSLDPAMAFPVEGRNTRAVGSVFGDPRDGGSRAHHGVDIFAPRGTPALASAAGRVNRVNVTNLGGKVVWLRDSRLNRNIYYAHLDSQVVHDGQMVEVGDTLGFVGNTGNARTTPPHLHYGIYIRREGPVDPLPYLRRPPGRMPSLPSNPEVLGTNLRTHAPAEVRRGPERDSPLVISLDAYAPVRVLGGSGSRFRVRLPDGASGYLDARLTEPAERPVDEAVALVDEAVTSRPEASAPVVDRVLAGATLPVLGSFGGYLLVRGPSGRSGWVASQDR